MSLKSGTESFLLALRNQFTGPINDAGLKSIFAAIKQVAGEFKFPDVQAKVANTVGAAATVVSGTGRLYGMRVVAGDTEVHVSAVDGATRIILGAVQAPAGGTAEAYFFGSDGDGVGVKFASSLQVESFAADGTTPSATTGRPTVTLFFGQP